MDKKGLSISELNNLLNHWKKRLLLEEWDLSIEIVDFAREDYPQNGDIRINYNENKAVVLISSKPIKNEEYIIVHELVHLILWKLDNYCENLVLEESTKKLEDYHRNYNKKLETTVDHLTKAFIKIYEKGNE